jgi:hypothetical protein
MIEIRLEAVMQISNRFSFSEKIEEEWLKAIINYIYINELEVFISGFLQLSIPTLILFLVSREDDHEYEHKEDKG